MTILKNKNKIKKNQQLRKQFSDHFEDLQIVSFLIV